MLPLRQSTQRFIHASLVYNIINLVKTPVVSEALIESDHLADN